MHRIALLLLVGAVALPASGEAAPAVAAVHTYGTVTRAGTGLSQAPAGFTGGPTTASDGETVEVYVQNELLAADPGAPQRWADLIASLVHGPEISTISVYVATLAQVTKTCGQGALGCYGQNRLIAMGQDIPGISARAVVMHEYGHHVADSRDNAPWQAVDYGTKRWATYMGVCQKANAGTLAPGDEGSRYTFNPGEALAEDYRVLNERLQSLPETQWGVVDDSLYPDQTALDLLRQDVTTPWTGNTTGTLGATFTARSTGRGFTVATPLDGTFAVTLTAPRTARLSLSLVDPATHKVLATATGSERVKYVETTVCGQRALQLQVKRVKGSGTFSVSVSKP